MAAAIAPIRRFPKTTPARAGHVWKVEVRDGDVAIRPCKWLYVALIITFMLTFIGLLAWLSVAGPGNVFVHDIWLP